MMMVASLKHLLEELELAVDWENEEQSVHKVAEPWPHCDVEVEVSRKATWNL